MRVLTAEEMRQVDRRAIDELGIPGPVLMENAAVALADAVGDEFPTARTVVLLCGPGNNGGDGLALARHLEGRGYVCRVFLVRRTSLPRGDAKLQWDILQRSGMEVTEIGPDDDLVSLQMGCERADLVVDALFGTGLSRPLEGHFAMLVEILRQCRAPVLAVDIPSGLDGSAAIPPGPHAVADVTVTFAAPKVPHVLEPSASCIGKLLVAELGLPSFMVPEAPGNLHLLTADELSAYLASRPQDGHKGTFGHVLVIAGGPGTAGAAVLATQAAVRSGAGLVTAAVPESLLQTVDGASLESMTVGLAQWADAAAVAEGKDAIAMGPGLSQAPSTAAAVRRLALDLDVPLVLDADALNALAEEPAHDGPADASSELPMAVLQQRTAPTVLTPHPGEMARLLGISTAQVQRDRLAAVRRAAQVSGAVVVLKGQRTLVAAVTSKAGATSRAGSEVGIWINPTGNAAMATGGSGDVLCGLLAGLLAQGYEVLAATQLAVFLHGLVADLWVQEKAPESLRAGDLVDGLGRAFETLR